MELIGNSFEFHGSVTDFQYNIRSEPGTELSAKVFKELETGLRSFFFRITTLVKHQQYIIIYLILNLYTICNQKSNLNFFSFYSHHVIIIKNIVFMSCKEEHVQ